MRIIQIIIIGRTVTTTIIIIPQTGIMPNTIITPVITIMYLDLITVVIIIMFLELIIMRATIIIITVHQTTTVIIIITVIMFQMVRGTPNPLITIIILIITGITRMEVITIITGHINPILTTSEWKAVDRGGTSLNEGADIMSMRPFKEVREVIVTESTSPDAVPAWTCLLYTSRCV